MEELEDKFEELEERVRQLQVDMGVGATAEAARALRSGDDTDVQVCQRFELRKCGKENRHFFILYLQEMIGNRQEREGGVESRAGGKMRHFLKIVCLLRLTIIFL